MPVAVAWGTIRRLFLSYVGAPRPHETSYRPDVDGLRAIAVLAVIVFHVVPTRLTGGFYGVDVFFVISGYLITGIISRAMERGAFSIAIFYERRIRRIFPALLAVLIAVLGAGWLLLLPEDYARLGLNAAGGAAFVANFLLWSQTGYFDGSSARQILLHLWSLGVEEQFYLAWPLILFATLKLRWGRTIVIGVLGLASFGLSLWLSQTDPTAAFYLPFSRFWELMAGALLAVAPAAFAPKAGKAPVIAPTLLSVAGLALILGSYLFTTAATFSPLPALAPVAGAVLLIAAGAHSLVNRYLLSNRLMVLIGLISYPLYLWHWPVLAFITVSGPDMSSATLRLLKLGAIVFTVLASVATYLWIEKPVRRLPVRTAVAGLGGGMVLVALVGLGIAFSQGAAFRYKPADRALIRNMAEEKAAFRGNVRTGVCFLEDDKVDLAPGCTPSAPRVLIWGDSHAASLYPGFRSALAHPDQDLAQYTGGNCLPLLDDTFDAERARCTTVSRAAARLLTQSPPKYVVMTAFWTLHQNRPGFDAALADTLQRAKASGATVVLVGPDASVPEKPQGTYLIGKPSTHLEARNTLLPQLRQADERLRKAAETAGVVYVSPFSSLCKGETCAVAVMVEGRRRLLTYDYGHLTEDGSIVYEKLLQPATPALQRRAMSASGL